MNFQTIAICVFAGKIQEYGGRGHFFQRISIHTQMIIKKDRKLGRFLFLRFFLFKWARHMPVGVPIGKPENDKGVSLDSPAVVDKHLQLSKPA